MLRRRPIHAACAALAALTLAGMAPADAIDRVAFGQVSPTATLWPGVIASKKGFFAAAGVEMEVVSIGVSPGQQAVASGSLDIMHNACNAIVAYIEQGGTGAKLSMVSMAGHPAVLIGRKGLANARDLKGKAIGTSSINSGSTILLKRLLKAKGLGDGDYDLVAGQGSAQIFQGLQAGALDAVWLVPPQSFTAAAAGYPVLGSFQEVAPKFMFVCFAVNSAWLTAKPDVAHRFARAWLQGVGWLYDPANRAEAEKLLAEELKITPQIATQSYDQLVVRDHAYPRDGKVDLDALRAVVEIMVEGKELPARPQGDVTKYVDDRLLK
ncbi:MAG TPA: ABC transporter substrate-binding protein [Xanthobacteraceae bacterium]|jgi:ABC-type nitrate/sulfonate/bicarbonate transport system substrate-binding protein|nr:ABC transporter substrate-binding protein [Xanthobacteraceae bacterium]